MASKLPARLAVALTAVILFGGTGYLGYRFIQDVSRSAEQIDSNVSPTNASGIPINDATLTGSPDSGFSGSLSQLQPAPEGVSSGQDVVVQAGEFGYQHGTPQIQLALNNQGKFNVSGVFVQLNLYLDGSKEPIGEPVIVQAALNEPLPIGQSTRTSLTVSNEAWRSSAVATAKSRRVVAQIVGVTDQDNGGMDYPQTSAGVLLRQTANDWSKPFDPNEAIGVTLNETASQVAQGSANIEVVAEQPPMSPQQIKPTNPDDISEFLEKPLPTGEPRIISVQVEEYRNGELVQQEQQTEEKK
ncbi:hypothetical protein ACKLNO_07350 [Neisseriaceae bacterium B1]